MNVQGRVNEALTYGTVRAGASLPVVMAGRREASFAIIPGFSHVMAGLDPAIHLVLCDGVRAKLDPRVKPGDDACGCGASIAPSQIQLSNSHCSSDMRHRPHCLRRGGAVVFAFPPPVRGRAERRVPVAPLGLMRMRSSAIVECIRTFGGAEQVPDVPHAVFFRLLAHLPWRTVPSPKLMSQGGGTG